ncbi:MULTISPECIES: hypothetical protein [Dehalobacter]|uniref:hypothetical protein n=1 Tax=Dehalobacter TaxID=56112 RepID=UPI0005507637|nr:MULTISPECIES: hypothetical protein [unclassified Dehalobacter]MDJ0306652.1 hypothetical protein [Dehalobacter sp.]
MEPIGLKVTQYSLLWNLCKAASVNAWAKWDEAQASQEKYLEVVELADFKKLFLKLEALVL